MPKVELRIQTMFGHAHVAGISKFRLKAEAQRTELSWIWTAEPEFTEHTNPCGSSSARGTLLLNFSNQEWAVRNSCMLCLCRHEAKRTTATSASLGSAASAVLGAMRPYIAGGESRQCVSTAVHGGIARSEVAAQFARSEVAARSEVPVIGLSLLNSEPCSESSYKWYRRILRIRYGRMTQIPGSFWLFDDHSDW